MTIQHFVWTEKYRPKTIDDVILPKRLKDPLSDFVKSGEIQNLIFVGKSGIGKTTVAHALANELGADVLFINASLENGIDVLRSKIAQFASTISLTGAGKIVILDEADGLNPSSFQPALRGFIEEFSSNCRFILTCNYIQKLIVPIQSRCKVINFNIVDKEEKYTKEARDHRLLLEKIWKHKLQSRHLPVKSNFFNKFFSTSYAR